MTVFNLLGQFIGLISPITRTLAGQGTSQNSVRATYPFVNSYIVTCCRESSLYMALLSFCLSLFCSFLVLKISFLVYFCFGFSLIRNCFSLCCLNLQVLVKIKGNKNRDMVFCQKQTSDFLMWLLMVINYYGDLKPILLYFYFILSYLF